MPLANIKKLEEAKSVAAKYGNDSLQEQLELQAKEIEQLARRRAIQSLINTDTLYIVSSTEFIENFNNFTERSVGALIKRKQSSDGNYYNNQTGKPSIEEVIEEELENGKAAIKILGGELKNIIEVSIEGTDLRHNIVEVLKVKECNKKYPRKAGTVNKNPLK